MSQPFLPAVGAVASADIAVPEHASEVRFYSRVLSTGLNPLWRADDLMNNLGLPIIGLGERTADYEQLPLQWMPHIQVADVAASVARCLALGGQELLHGKDEQGASQWAVLLDPNQTAFGIIPVIPAEAMPPELASEAAKAPVGRIAWLDLTVTNAADMQDFYQQVIGWSPQAVEMNDAGETYSDYNLLREDGEAAAGICHARGANSGLPPVWMLYLPVADLPKSLQRVTEEGGKIIQTTPGPNGQPLYAIIQDRVGVHFALAAEPEPQGQNQ